MFKISDANVQERIINKLTFSSIFQARKNIDGNVAKCTYLQYPDEEMKQHVLPFFGSIDEIYAKSREEKTGLISTIDIIQHNDAKKDKNKMRKKE